MLQIVIFEANKKHTWNLGTIHVVVISYLPE